MDSDIYYIPPHLSHPFTADEIAAYVRVYRANDGADGYADAAHLPLLMNALGEKLTDAKSTEVSFECDPGGSGNLGFLDILRIAARFRSRREPFGGKRSITDELPTN